MKYIHALEWSYEKFRAMMNESKELIWALERLPDPVNKLVPPSTSFWQLEEELQENDLAFQRERYGSLGTVHIDTRIDFAHADRMYVYASVGLRINSDDGRGVSPDAKRTLVLFDESGAPLDDRESEIEGTWRMMLWSAQIMEVWEVRRAKKGDRRRSFAGFD